MDTVTNLTEEEPEGLDEDEDASLGEYPIDTVLIRNEHRTVRDVLHRIEEDAFIMNPDFQRDFIWPDDKQSKLIESVLMRIPLPVFYLAEKDDGRTVVVDGLQRLATFQRFVNNKLKLKTPKQPELDQKQFKELSPKLQNRVEDCNLVLYIIDAKVPQKVLLDIFDRVNSGMPLTRQQMRNCLFMGSATAFLKTEARTAEFLKATGWSLRTATMRDREFVNRFCAFQIIPIEKYSADIDTFLADALEQINKYDAPQIEQLSNEFRLGLENNTLVFGEHAFRKHTPGQYGRNVINASLWDVMSTGFSHYPMALVKSHKVDLKTGFYNLMNNEKFFDAISFGTNAVNKVKYRFREFNNMLVEVLGARTN